MVFHCPDWKNLAGAFLTEGWLSALPCGVTAFLCHYNLHEHFEGWSSGDAGITIYSGFTFALGFLIVFRMNQAYSRWWEAGTLLQQARAEWFNAYSSLIALSNPAPEKAGEVLRFQHMLARLMSLLYGASILQLCTMKNPSLQIIHIDGMDEVHLKFLEQCHDKVEVVLQWVQKAVVSADSDGTIQAAAPIISRVYNQLGSGMANITTARKMIEFPIPYPIRQLIPIMLGAQWIATVMISTMLVRSSIWAALLSFMNTFCFWSINYLARELEMPYGDDPDDLPLQHLQADMNASLACLLHPLALRAPSFDLPISKGGDVHLQPGIMEIQHDGSMDFRPMVTLTSNGPAAFDCPETSSGLSKCPSPQHQHDAFHAPRLVIGKKGIFRRGPTLEACVIRVQATKANVEVSHRDGMAATDGSGASNVDRDTRECDVAVNLDATHTHSLERLIIPI